MHILSFPKDKGLSRSFLLRATRMWLPLTTCSMHFSLLTVHTCYQRFLLISCNLHSPPGSCLHSSFQAGGTATEKKSHTIIKETFRTILQLQLLTIIWFGSGLTQHVQLIFIWIKVTGVKRRTFLSSALGKTLGRLLSVTCFCLVIRSQSSTSHGFNSSGIFTFTSTRLINVSSCTKTVPVNNQFFLVDCQNCRIIIIIIIIQTKYKKKVFNFF